MTLPLAERRRASRHRRALAYWGVMIALYVSLWLGTQLVPQPWLHMVMLFGHLASIIIGLGAAVFLEFNGFLWTIERRSLSATCATTERLGLGGRVDRHPRAVRHGCVPATRPLEQPLTVIKMGAVLLVAMNGVAMTRLTAELSRLPGPVPLRLGAASRASCGACGVPLVSQVGWWTAVIIGMLNTASQ